MIVIETVSAASAIGTIAAKVRPARKSGNDVSAKPNTYARPTAIAIVARFPQPNAVPIAIPATSPITQPVRQWFVADTARAFRLRSL